MPKRLLLVFLLTTLLSARPYSASPQPNILLLVVDDVGAEASSLLNRLKASASKGCFQ